MGSESPTTPHKPPALFFSDYGLRSGWRILLFIVISAVVALCLSFPLHSLLTNDQPVERRLPAGESLSAAAFLLATWILVRFIDRKPLASFGFSPVGAVRRFALGLLFGFLSLTLLIGLLVASHAYTWNGLALHGSAIFSYGALWAVTFLLVSLSEELIARGYLLFGLTQAIGFWPAAILLSVLFASGHMKNQGETTIGVVAAGLIGLFLAWTIRRTGSLWWAFGYHAAWDWAESYFYGVADSGSLLNGHLFAVTSRGPVWLSGGTAGPEGSLLVLPVIALLAGAVYLTFRNTPPAELVRYGSAESQALRRRRLESISPLASQSDPLSPSQPGDNLPV